MVLEARICDLSTREFGRMQWWCIIMLYTRCRRNAFTVIPLLQWGGGAAQITKCNRAEPSCAFICLPSIFFVCKSSMRLMQFKDGLKDIWEPKSDLAVINKEGALAGERFRGQLWKVARDVLVRRVVTPLWLPSWSSSSFLMHIMKRYRPICAITLLWPDLTQSYPSSPHPWAMRALKLSDLFNKCS